MEKKISFKGTAVTIEDKLNIGDIFPNFSAVKKDLSDFKLDEYKGNIVVINTFPSIDTGVWALQTIRFNKEVSGFKDVVAVTVSKDLPFALGRFCAAEGIENAITVSDYKYRDIENLSGLLIKELGLLTRAVFIVDADGIIRYKEVLEEVGSEPNYEAALLQIKKLQER